MINYPFVITVSSEKGGVGKTTLATNLAVFLKALDENLPVSIFSFDNHFTIDKMFAIKGQQQTGSVTDLLNDIPGHKLLHTGQYGVNYIPSSTAMNVLKSSVKNPMALAGILAAASIPGILIIDTRPDLDILTQNALYAADRVLIPIKDMPSMENCRNIFDLFDKKGLDKKSLTLIPCLIDERIKFEGPFSDQKSLLRAYAINRGFRCHETYISKSPKVESLTTNPEGKVYPVLTHGRGTDVYGQFTQLARSILDEYETTASPRSQLFHNWQNSENERKKNELFARLSGVRDDCIICGKPLGKEAHAGSAFYYEASDGAMSGFMESTCFIQLMMSDIYRISKDLASDEPARLIIEDSSRESIFAFMPICNNGVTTVEFHRFDFRGDHLLKKGYPLEPDGKNTEALYALMQETLSGFGGNYRDAFLMVHPVNNNNPHALLHEDSYREMHRLKKRIAEQLSQ